VAVDLRIDEKYRPLVGPRSRVSPTQQNPLSDGMLAISPAIARPVERRPPADLRLAYEPGLDLPAPVKGFNGTLEDVGNLASTMAEDTGRTSETARKTMEVHQQTGERLGESARETTRVIRSGAPSSAAPRAASSAPHPALRLPDAAQRPAAGFTPTGGPPGCRPPAAPSSGSPSRP
jgi:hypothetical protein